MTSRPPRRRWTRSRRGANRSRAEVARLGRAGGRGLLRRRRLGRAARARGRRRPRPDRGARRPRVARRERRRSRRRSQRSRRSWARSSERRAAPVDRGPEPGGARPRRPVRTRSSGPASSSAPRWCSSVTPPTTRPRRCCSTCCAARRRSGLAGMAPRHGHVVRPLLGLPARADARALCEALGLERARPTR